MSTTLFYGTAAFFAIVAAVHYYNKSKRLRNEAQSQRIKYDRVRAEVESLHSELDKKAKERSDILRFLASAEYALKTSDFGNVICVRAVGLNSRPFSFTIKGFAYDPNDKDDHEFAMREAEELIEKIGER